MIYDGFTFFNELDLLELRLKTLSEYIDKFVIVESAYTFTGKRKSYNFEENRERYKKYEHQIIYIKVDRFPEDCKSAWDREAYQRNEIEKGFKTRNADDIYLVSDLDEIPNPSSIKRIKKALKQNSRQVLCLELLNCWFYLNNVEKMAFFWGAPKACTAEEYYSVHDANCSTDPLGAEGKFTAQSLRSIKNYSTVPVAGWHFTYLGGADKIREKVQAFSHQEYNMDRFLTEEHINSMIASGLDLYGRDFAAFGSVKINYLMPLEIRRNKEKYAEYITTINPMPIGKRVHLRMKYLCELLPGVSKMYQMIKSVKRGKAK